MKVLRVGSYPTKEKNGMGYHSYMITPLEGVSTLFLTFENNEHRLPAWENTTVASSYWFNQARPRNANALVLTIFHIRRLLGILRFTFKGWTKMFSYNPDLVHIHSPMLIGISALAKLRGKKNCITFHGTDFHRVKNAKWYHVLAPKLIDSVFCISPDMLPRMKEIHGTSKVYQVFNGYDENVFTNKKLKREKTFVAVGSLKEEKGFEQLINAFAGFKKKDTQNHSLVIAGEGRLRGQLEAQIKKLGLEENIRLLGHLNRDQVVELYNKSEYFVLSSNSEGFPKVILESMGCGCKIVTTDVGVIPQILKDYKYMVPSGSVDKLTNALVDIVQEDDGFFDMYASILNEFSWPKTRRIYKSVYTKINDSI